MKLSRLLPAVIALGLPAAALAETPERCALVGQMSGSVWLEMIQALGDEKPEAVASAISRLEDLTATYARIGCDQDALNGTMDCVLTDASADSPRGLLRQCMVRNGIARD